MRFSRLSLERYGRFDGCELDFRPGGPDLHIIYGGNEAGKTTSLAAVSDLLFGFPSRSPYNFLFDYSLLRVGAVLVDGEQTLACRRKKGTTGTLLDAEDAPLDEALLAAMLKGQTRETFSLSFSLDQSGLRAGGRAMIEAKNDLGRTLFAAGSGLTGVADELRRLEAEADAIWAPSSSQRRTFTQAQRQLTEATRAIRDEALKPKAWSDARQQMEVTSGALEAARKARDQVQAELRSIDRIRRLAPLVRRRNEQLEALRACDGTIELGQQREDLAEKVIREAGDAERQRATALQLREDAAARRAQVVADPAVFELADDIDQLLVDAGAGEKAQRDLVRLEAELTVASAQTQRLRSEAGANADLPPLTRILVAKLRDLARTHGEFAAADHQISESRADIEERRKRADRVLKESPASPAFDMLVDAVDAAGALGRDADARVEVARRRAEASSAAIVPLLRRLAPWSGTIDELLKLPRLDEREIEAAREGLAEILREIRRDEEQAQRLTDQAATLNEEIQQLATGAVVSPEEIASAKHNRQDLWLPIRSHVLAGTPLSPAEAAVAAFEASIEAVDEKLDLRFTFADASSRLSLLEQDKARHDLQAAQTRNRAEIAKRKHAEAKKVWCDRLSAARLPALEPSAFLTWQTGRTTVEAAHGEYLDQRRDFETLAAQRDGCRNALAKALGMAELDASLSSLLATAERKRAEIEEANQRRRSAQEQLDQVATDMATLSRRQQKLDDEKASHARVWQDTLVEAGLQIDIKSCGTVLDLLDELRQASNSESDLRRRVEGIRRDSREFGSRMEAIAESCGIPAGDTNMRLRTMRARVVAARAAATLIESIGQEERRRQGEVDEAAAKLKAADVALASLLMETRSTDRTELAAAIERSRAKRKLREEFASTERQIVDEGDGLALDELVAAASASNPDEVASQASALEGRLSELNDEVDRTATAFGDARQAFVALDTGATSAADAAAEAEQARSELEVLAEHYILKRAQAVTLKWAIEKYRERHQDPLLLRAGQLFSILTTGRFSTLRVDADGPSPRLLGLRDDGRTMVEVGAMSEGTSDQLFLALRLAALEQSVAAGVNLPFLADDLFVNFDDQRAEAGFKVLAEVAMSTQVLFFTHHPHLTEIAKSVVGAKSYSECALH